MTEERKKLFVCLACGKMSRDFIGREALSRGWDESCAINSREVWEDAIEIKNGRVVSVPLEAFVNPPALKS